MESPYDSDMSDETRDLVEQGLAINRKKYSSRVGHDTDAYGLAPDRDMDTSSIRLPPTCGAIKGEPSTHGHNPTDVEDVGGQNRNTISKQSVGCSLKEMVVSRRKH